MRLPPDVIDLPSEFDTERVEFLVVGAHALAAHGLPRATGDFDIWVHATPENARRVTAALARWIGDVAGLDEGEFANAGSVVQFGVAPWRIDLLTQLSGVQFTEAWPERLELRVGSLRVPFLGRDDLVRNKVAAGRPKDLADLAWLRGEVDE